MNIVIADSDEEARLELSSLVREYYSENGIDAHVHEVATGSLAQMVISLNDVDLIFTDIKLPHKDGLSILRDLRDDGDNTKVVVVSSLSVKEIVSLAKEFRTTDYICKPFTDQTVKDKLAKLSIKKK